jgi:hypothetical protein
VSQQPPIAVAVHPAPVKAGWILLIAAWIFFLIPIPGFGPIGWALNLGAFIVAIVVMTRGRSGIGLVQLLCALLVSPFVYFIGLAVAAATWFGGA